MPTSEPAKQIVYNFSTSTSCANLSSNGINEYGFPSSSNPVVSNEACIDSTRVSLLISHVAPNLTTRPY